MCGCVCGMVHFTELPTFQKLCFNIIFEVRAGDITMWEVYAWSFQVQHGEAV